MIVFYAAAVALLLAGLLFAFWPWLRFHLAKAETGGAVQSSGAIDRQNTNIALYHDHLADLHNSRAQGSLDEQQFDQLRQELERNLLKDSAETEVSVKPGRGQLSLPALVLLLLVPLAAVVLYQSLGNLESLQISRQLQAQAELEQRLGQQFDWHNNAEKRQIDHSLEIEQQLNQLNRELVARLYDYAARRPDDLDTRVLLARNAMGVGEYNIAIESYRHILDRQPDAAQMLAELAQAVFIRADNRAVPVVAILAERALKIQPDNAIALGLLGISSFQNEHYAEAIRYWEQAIEIHPADSANARALTNGIIQARNRLGALEDDAADSEPESSDHQAVGIARVRVAVSFDESVTVNPEHPVFIYARAWKGSRMPLAMIRIPAAQLPLTVELNDTMSMTPAINLSSSKQVELVARLSVTGSATPRPGDIEATFGPVNPAVTTDTTHSLVLSKTKEIR